MALALPNEAFRFGCGFLGFLAIVPLYVLLLESPSYGSSALLVGVFGALQHAFSSYWLWFFKDFRFWTLGSTTLAYGVIYAVLGLYLRLFALKTGKARPLAFALLWVVFEYTKSTGFLGYPWGLIPYSLTNCLPLLQIADLTGVYGISFVLALSNAVVAELLMAASSCKPRGLADPGSPMRIEDTFSPFTPRLVLGYAGIALLLTGGMAAYGYIRMSRPVTQVGTLKAVLVQQNLDPWDVGEETVLATNVALARKALSDYASAAARSAEPMKKPDIILFSETTLQRPYADFRNFYSQRPKNDPLIHFIRDTGTWLFTGSPIVLDWDTMDATNSVILIDPSARQVADYAKVHPVPFAEAIPFWNLPAFKNFIQKVVGLDSGWVMGTKYTIFELPTDNGIVRFGAPICFEDAFSEVCREYFARGADILINLTNDSWSKTVSAEIQHWAAARFRSIEFRRTLVRSTNGGLSCVVGPFGELREELPLFETTSKVVDIPICREAGPTAYARYGDWFALDAVLLSIIWSLILMIGEAATKGGKGHEHYRIP